MDDGYIQQFSADAEKKAFGDRLCEAAKLAGKYYYGMYSDLARHFAMTPGGTKKWFMGEAMPRGEKFESLAEYYRVRSEWLRNGQGGPRAVVGVLSDGMPENVEVHRIPILAADELEMFMSGDLAPCVENLCVIGAFSTKCFAIKIPDDSLLPQVPRGVTLVVDGVQDPRIGDLAVAVLHNTFVCGYLTRRAQFTLVPLNTGYSPVELGEYPNFAGTVVAVAQRPVGELLQVR